MKLNILLIDDSDADNFLHKLVLEQAGVVQEINVFTYAEDALTYLKTPDRPFVDLILLDINMPRMNGFQFLEEYGELYDELKAKTITLMLSTSLNPEDRERAEKHQDVSGFLNKPLLKEKLMELLETLFPE